MKGSRRRSDWKSIDKDVLASSLVGSARCTGSNKEATAEGILLGPSNKAARGLTLVGAQTLVSNDREPFIQVLNAGLDASVVHAGNVLAHASAAGCTSDFVGEAGVASSMEQGLKAAEALPPSVVASADAPLPEDPKGPDACDATIGLNHAEREGLKAEDASLSKLRLGVRDAEEEENRHGVVPVILKGRLLMRSDGGLRRYSTMVPTVLKGRAGTEVAPQQDLLQNC
ncbi:unnamed protein product [Lampetra fluviatilis]